MTDDKKQPEEHNEPPRKLCSNCAYRATCNKRFNAKVVDGRVLCMEHAYDVTLLKKNEQEDAED